MPQNLPIIEYGWHSLLPTLDGSAKRLGSPFPTGFSIYNPDILVTDRLFLCRRNEPVQGRLEDVIFRFIGKLLGRGGVEFIGPK